MVGKEEYKRRTIEVTCRHCSKKFKTKVSRFLGGKRPITFCKECSKKKIKDNKNYVTKNPDVYKDWRKKNPHYYKEYYQNHKLEFQKYQRKKLGTIV